MRKRMILMLVALIIVFGGIFGYTYRAQLMFLVTGEMPAMPEQPPTTVAAAEARQARWTAMLEATGSLRAKQGVDVTTEVAGSVDEIAFESGQRVSRGDLLVALDTSTEKAELKGLQARTRLARQTLDRKRSLRERDLGSQADVDQAQAEYDNAMAGAEAKKAVIEKKTIQAPFTGIVGLRQVDLGQYLAPGTAVVTLQALDPIYLDFSLPQQQLDKVREGQTVRLRIQGLEQPEHTGSIVAISPKVEAGTRSFQVRAELTNAEGRLRPGMFGNVQVVLEESREVVTLPQTAITYNPYGDTVFKIVEQQPEDGGEPVEVAKRVSVRTGETRADQVQVLAGVEPGDRVVVAGQLKLSGGDRVRIDNEIVPESKAELSDVENR